MYTGKLDHALMQEIEALQEEGRAKAPERIIVDYIPAAGEKGPRYILKGLNRQFHPDSCVKGSAGSKSNFLSSYHRSGDSDPLRKTL